MHYEEGGGKPWQFTCSDILFQKIKLHIKQHCWFIWIDFIGLHRGIGKRSQKSPMMIWNCSMLHIYFPRSKKLSSKALSRNVYSCSFLKVTADLELSGSMIVCGYDSLSSAKHPPKHGTQTSDALPGSQPNLEWFWVRFGSEPGWSQLLPQCGRRSKGPEANRCHPTTAWNALPRLLYK